MVMTTAFEGLADVNSIHFRRWQISVSWTPAAACTWQSINVQDWRLARLRRHYRSWSVPQQVLESRLDEGTTTLRQTFEPVPTLL